MRNQIRGFGLIELLISILIGLIVVAGITSMVVATLRANTENLEMTRLTQEMRSVMQLVTRDLRRGGYDQDAVRDFGSGGQTSNQFMEISAFDDSNTEKFLSDGISQTSGDRATCILYSYDANGDGAAFNEDGSPQVDEFRGFRFDSENNAIEAKVQGNPADSSCDDGTWETLTDTATVRVDEFSISTPEGNAVPVMEDVSGNPILTLRTLVFRLDAGLVNDPDVQRSMRETVRIRNDLLN